MRNTQHNLRTNAAEGTFVTLQARTIRNMSELVTEEVFDGEMCWVIPTILMAEGVHNGLRYTVETFESWVGSWNGEPVTVGHPSGPDGKSVSANSPDILEQSRVGWLFNVHVDGNKLKGNSWVSQKRARKISPALCQRIENGDMIEVSTGVFIEDDGKAGVWNGEPYKATVVGQSPDHLALLLDCKGACSIEDGAGAPRINKEEQNMDVKERKTWLAKVRAFFKTNDPSFRDVEQLLRAALTNREYPNGLSGSEPVDLPYIVDVYDKFVVYEAKDGDKFGLYKQAYSIGANDNVELNGDAVRVKMKRDYVPVSNDAEPENPAPTTEGAHRGGEDMDRKNRVDALIAANARWGEESRQHLMELKDADFARVTAEAAAPEAPAAAVAPVVPAAVPEAVNAAAPDVLKQHPELQRAVDREKRYVAQLKAGLKANAACKLNDARIDAMEDVEALEELASSFQVEADYSGRSTAPEANVEEDDSIPAPPTLNFDEKGDK